jgi:hypothetical protein
MRKRTAAQRNMEQLLVLRQHRCLIALVSPHSDQLRCSIDSTSPLGPSGDWTRLHALRVDAAVLLLRCTTALQRPWT